MKAPGRSRAGAKIESPSVRDRAILLRGLEQVMSKHPTWKLAKCKSLREAHDEIVELVQLLENDEEVIEVEIFLRDFQSASILSLCKTLQALKVPEINKVRICLLLRERLQSEEPCKCTKDHVAEREKFFPTPKKPNLFPDTYAPTSA